MNKNLLRKVLISSIFLIPLIALFNTSVLIFPFITGKAFIFRLLIELLACIWVLLIIVDKKYRPKFNWLNGSVLAFIIVLTIADIFGVNPLKSLWGNFERMDGLIGMIHLAVYFIIAGTIIDTEKLWARLFNTTIGVSVIVSLLGLAQLAGLMTVYTANNRLDSTVGNAAYLALYLLIHIFLVIYMYAKSSGKGRYVYIAIGILHLIIMYLTATRSAVLGLIGGLLVIAILWMIFAREQKKLRITAVVTISVLVLLMLGFFAVRNRAFVRNNAILDRFNGISIQGFLNQSRYYIWSEAVQGIKERPALGWGQENFSTVNDKYYRTELSDETINFDRAHNLVLDWLVASGILGLLAYLSIFVVTFCYIWKSDKDLTQKSILTGLIVAYFINNLFIFDNITSFILFFTILAYVYSGHVASLALDEVNVPYGIKPETKHETKRERRKDQEKRNLVPILIVPTIAVFLFVAYLLNARGLIAAYEIREAYTDDGTLTVQGIGRFQAALAQKSFGNEEIRQKVVSVVTNIASSPDLDASTRYFVFNLASKEMKDQLDNFPPNSYNYYLAGGLFYAYGKADEALVLLEKAREISPTKQEIISKIAEVRAVQKH